MAFDRKIWKEKLPALMCNLRSKVTEWGVDSVYGLCLAVTLWPALEAFQSGDPTTIMGVGAAVGTSLIFEHLGTLKSKPKKDQPAYLAELLEDNQELQDKVQELMTELGSLSIALEESNPEDRAWLHEKLTSELGRWGYGIRIEGGMENSILALDESRVVGQNGQQFNIDGDHSEIFTGNGNIYTKYEEGSTHLEQKFISSDPLETNDKLTQQKIDLYLDKLINECQVLPMAPLGGDSTGDLEITLDQIYIALDTLAKRNWQSKIEKENYLKENIVLEYIFDAYEQCPIAAMEAVQKERRMVLLGDPGSGKSTFIKKIAGTAAREWKGSQTTTLLGKSYFPVIITLRELSVNLGELKEISTKNEENEALNIFRTLINKKLLDYGIKGFQTAFLKILQDQPCLLVFDGMDEVPQNLRRVMRTWIETIIRHYRPQKVIITCRIRSYFEEVVLREYPAYTLAPFTQKQIKDFTLAWYRTKKDLKEQQQEERAGDFFNRVKAERNILEMASNPMLLTQMAVLHQRDTKLPDICVKLYEEVVVLLLHRWQDYHEIKIPISEKLESLLQEGEMIRKAMEHLAFEAHNLGRGAKQAADLPRKTTLDLLQKDEYLGNFGLAEEFLIYLDQRCGLLQGRGGRMEKPDSYAFPHRTFQEYLAGCYLNRQNKNSKFRLLCQLAAEGDFWDIVYKMSIEECFHIGRDPDLTELAFKLCAKSCLEDERGQRLVYWAALLGELLGTKTILEYRDETLIICSGDQYLQKIRENILGIFSGPLPPLERVEAGNALSLLGDPRFHTADFYHLPVDGKEKGDGKLGFIRIPVGKFWMGSDDSLYKNEQPYHECDLDYEYYLARFPVSVAQWRVYTLAEKWDLSERWLHFNHYVNHPVAYVNWVEVLNYCHWLERMLKENSQTPTWLKSLFEQGYRIILPSEAEWEKAARGSNGLKYPYGNTFDAAKGNTRETGIYATSPVGCFAAGSSPWGCLDMSGNVWEWTRSLYCEYDKKSCDYRDGRENLESSDARVLHGGSCYFDLDYARCAYRGRSNPVHRGDLLGFRLCLSPSNLLNL